MTQLQRPSRIPEFESFEEEAEFWDTHDFTDYLDELTPVEVRFARELSEGVTVRLNSELLAKLHAQAKAQDMDPSLLARLWILEHLQETNHSTSSPS
jgi:predicted DNA binding CopG/RHH family protein